MHNFDITRREIDFHGRKLIIETGKMAKQANGSVYLQLGETSVLVTATMSKDAVEIKILPAYRGLHRKDVCLG